jgi:hypothetical protein
MRSSWRIAPAGTARAAGCARRVLAAGRGVLGHEIAFCPRFAVGHPRVPTVAGGVFHAWYVSRLLHTEDAVLRETGGQVSRAGYLDPLMAKLRAEYGLTY